MSQHAVKMQSSVIMLITENGEWMNLNSSKIPLMEFHPSLNMVQQTSVTLSVSGIENQFRLSNTLLVSGQFSTNSLSLFQPLRNNKSMICYVIVSDSQVVHVHTVKCILMGSVPRLLVAASSNTTERISLCDMVKNM